MGLSTQGGGLALHKIVLGVGADRVKSLTERRQKKGRLVRKATTVAATGYDLTWGIRNRTYDYQDPKPLNPKETRDSVGTCQSSGLAPTRDLRLMKYR